MNAKKIHEMNNQELVNKLSELKKELFNLRMSHATGQLANSTALRNCKRDIAKVKTILRERELGISGSKE